tara:strand:+ start:278 stop:541 length:264 start_codon:yes stop_codon:yes gene_type:complete
MFKEIKYFIFLLIIGLFIFFSIKFYVSEENKKKTFKSLLSIDQNTIFSEKNVPLLSNDTDNIVKYLSNEDSLNRKKYSFWELLKNDN